MSNKRSSIEVRRFHIAAALVAAGFCLAPKCSQDDETERPEKATPKVNAPTTEKAAAAPDVVTPKPAEQRMGELELRVRKLVKRNRTRPAALELGEEAVPILLSIIGDDQDALYFENAIGILGHIGSERALDPLMDLLEKSSGELSWIKCKYFMRVPLAIGDIARKGSARAFDYLKQRVRDEDWKGMTWTCERGPAPEELRRIYAERSIIGLALTGSDEAERILHELMEEARQRPESIFKERRISLIEGALQNLHRMKELGEDKYYAPRPYRRPKTDR